MGPYAFWYCDECEISLPIAVEIAEITVAHVVELLERPPYAICRVVKPGYAGASGGRLLQYLETLSHQLFALCAMRVYILRIGRLLELGEQAVKERAAVSGSGGEHTKLRKEIPHIALVEPILTHLPRRRSKFVRFVDDHAAICGQ